MLKIEIENNEPLVRINKTKANTGDLAYLCYLIKSGLVYEEVYRKILSSLGKDALKQVKLKEEVLTKALQKSILEEAKIPVISPNPTTRNKI